MISIFSRKEEDSLEALCTSTGIISTPSSTFLLLGEHATTIIAKIITLIFFIILYFLTEADQKSPTIVFHILTSINENC